VSGIPSQAGDFCSDAFSAEAASCVALSADALPLVPPQVALRLALVQAVQGKLIGADDALRAMAAIEQLDPPTE
jgi:hypothetical protein